MRRRTWFAIGLGLGLCLAVTPFVVKKRSCCGMHHSYSHVPVVVVAQDLQAGTVLTMEMISQRSIPEALSTRSIVKPDSASHVVGQRLLVDLQAGDMVRWGDVGADTLAVDKRVRGFTLSVDPARMISGQLTRGDHVDVLMSLDDPMTKERVARTLLQNVTVLGVNGHEVTVRVLAEEAEALMLAQDLGRFAIALRNRDDPEVMEYAGRATIGTLLSGERTQGWAGCRMRRQIEIIPSATP